MIPKSILPLFLLLSLFAAQTTAQDCTNDQTPPIAVCNSAITVAPFENGVLLWPDDIDEGSTDNCGIASLRIRRFEDGPCDDDNLPDDFADSIFVCCQDAGSIFVVALQVTDLAGLSSTCWMEVIVPDDPEVFCDTSFLTLTGKVFIDAQTNCLYDAGEAALNGWPVRATGLTTGRTYSASANPDGTYFLKISSLDTLVEVRLDVPFNYGQGCPTTYTAAPAPDSSSVQDFPVALEPDCALLSVDIGANRMLRCFDNTYYVQACNYSDDDIAGVYVEVQLDNFLEFNSASIPSIDLGGNARRFDLGQLEAGACSTFAIHFTISCDAPLGYTHCTQANIYPDTACNLSPLWSGAEVDVRAFCDGDSVRVAIENKGAGDMNGPLEFVVVEDVIMYHMQNFQLLSGEALEIALPANGATWRVEAEQEPFHPWGGPEAAAVEGCGGLNEAGLVNQFVLNNSNPFEVVFCRPNTGSYDPNDKQAFPAGYGPEHFIRKNTGLEYLIRFQNTGTDTAFTVVVLDTLSAFLDASSVRPGAASHQYTFEVLDGPVLRFRFDNIMLPDSNINEPLSNGFVKFSVDQQPDNPEGTVIDNSAAIYFDFNEPVITNTVWHTIGDHFILVNSLEPAGGVHMEVFPNPATEYVFFKTDKPLNDGIFLLTDAQGRVLHQEKWSGALFRFERRSIPSGWYPFRIQDGGKVVASGLILLQ